MLARCANVDTMIVTLLVFSQPSCTIFDIGAMLSCVSEEFVNACGVNLMSTAVCMFVSTPLGVVEPMSRACRDIDITVVG